MVRRGGVRGGSGHRTARLFQIGVGIFLGTAVCASLALVSRAHDSCGEPGSRSKRKVERLWYRFGTAAARHPLKVEVEAAGIEPGRPPCAGRVSRRYRAEVRNLPRRRTTG